jgi:predicted permease
MSLLRSIASGLRSLFRREQVSQDLDEELNGFLEMAAQEKMKEGMSRKDALRAVRLEQGSLEVTKEAVRAAGWESFVETLWQDLRFAARMLRKSPGFTAITVATLALGIGVTTSALTALRVTLLWPVDVSDPEHVAQLFLHLPGSGATSFPFQDYVELRDRKDVFEELVAYHSANVMAQREATASDSSPTAAEDYSADLVSANYFSLLGAKMAVGRVFTSEEDRTPGAHPVLVLSYSSWQRRFGGQPTIVGQTVLVGDYPFVVIGVTGPDFQGFHPVAPDFWIPLRMQREAEPGSDSFARREIRWLRLIGRLRPELSFKQAEAALAVVAQGWAQPSEAHQTTRIVMTGIGVLNAENRRTVVPIMILAVLAVGSILAVSCTNAAGLLLARGAVRRTEINTRLALGASRARLIQQLLVESVILSLLSGAAGVILAQWCTSALYVALAHLTHRPPAPLDFSIDGPVLSAAVVVSILTGLGCGLAPALQATQQELTATLNQQGANLTDDPKRSRLRNVLVTAQVALSLLLLVSAGLFTRTLSRIQSSGPGFDIKDVILVTSDPVRQGYTPARATGLYQTLVPQLADVPGVRCASLSKIVPVSDNYWLELLVMGQTAATTSNSYVSYDVVSPDYFSCLRIPIVRGRGFTIQDQQDGNAVIVNESFVRHWLGGGDPIGQHLRAGDGSGSWQEIVGVAKDTMHGRFGEPSEPLVYHPVPVDYPPNMALLIRTDGGLENGAALAAVLHRADQHVSFSIRTLEANMSATMWPARVGAFLTSTLGLLALLMTAVGLFGLIACTVSQRTREVGIRMALGAPRSAIVGLVLGQALKLVLMGLALGLAAAAVSSRVLTNFLFGLSPWDPGAFAGGALVLLGVALLASYVPCRRAMRVDPMVALRYE